MVLALSLLAIFGILGTAYVGYMNLSLMETDMGVRTARADQLAVAGVQIALEGLRQEVLNPNRYNIRGETARFELSTYHGIEPAEGGGVIATSLGLAEDPDGSIQPRLAMANVTIYDESARININHAPASVLQRALKVDVNTARQVASSVPAAGSGPDSKWFLALDELIHPALLTQEQFDALDLAQLTVHSVGDHTKPTGYFNVNEASPTALAAVLNVTEEQAIQIKAKAGDGAGFTSMQAFNDAVAEVTGSPFSGAETKDALALESRCFRVVSEGRYAKILDQAAYDAAEADQKSTYVRPGGAGRVEAVFLFGDDGSYEVLHWSTDRDVTAGPA